ncbi:hypothetical protein, partial [Prevotella denticola]|uniref:hypothetical protein n=1 Tax=Prevotella denticola TaxID=28129 RepID=UPI00325FD671
TALHGFADHCLTSRPKHHSCFDFASAKIINKFCLAKHFTDFFKKDYTDSIGTRLNTVPRAIRQADGCKERQKGHPGQST